ncbi:hypothetical protein PRIPAC_85654 [Pristionchus pacificus]|uniref:Tyrosine phosphatase n=1 Tax=Pristionchus pacificus TaxID=54126 RepID=A0A2A6BMG1_PRIPA|nr:hypothetical protein PRIPAC_85654 [Pristionchus pacificus]|eukprot:PDM67142.1 tyrosine phosphatase [Pristionchus pacificus]
MGSKNKNKGSTKGDKKDKNQKKKSKSSSNLLKKMDKKNHGGKKGHHEKKGSHAGPPMVKAPGHHKPPMQGKGEMIARTPPLDPRAYYAQQQQQQQQQGRPIPPQRPIPQQRQPGPTQQQQPRPQQPQQVPVQGKGQVRSSQSLSAESMTGQQQQQRPPPPQPAAAAAQRPVAAPPPAARPFLQQQQQRQLPLRHQQHATRPALPMQQTPQQRSPQQISPDLEKTEKKSGKKGAAAGNKISKFLDIKFSVMVDQHRKFLGSLPNSVSRAAFDDNMCLNRFEDVICIDQTRVLFSDSSLYLNANWVTIEPGKKPEEPPKQMAIVAQLPLPECAEAFWSMIAENDIKGILLFCDDNEFLTFGADKIFPMNKATVQISPRITVTHTHRLAVNAEWTMNVYLMCRGDVRKYLHVHLYAWGGDEEIRLKNLWEIESVFRRYSSPHVYMSSAGVGRASTFAALRMAHIRMHDETCKEVNLNNCIVSLREQRLHSIQSLTQSVTVHSALIQHIVDCPSFEKLEHDPRVCAFRDQYKEYLANPKE